MNGGHFMFKIVLIKLIECIKTRNQHALSGDFATANRYIDTYNLLSDCLREAGCETDLITEPAKTHNVFVGGMTINLVTAIKIKIDSNSNDYEAAKSIGFVSDDEYMLYHFER
jgi:hypothetical protein